ncbi:MAG: hypothetical protein JRE40_02080 [Deltaproteobacteria bacterium]|nr:hypothetical protein [Deltaproteobacteria bacterium]MBW2672540.1 hypothetical protein [Deltaproteobacteria bacterium]
MPALTQLIPVQELAPGAVAAIRNEVVNFLLAKASSELKMGRDLLIARDLRPQSDLDWGSDATTGLAKTALTTDIWNLTSDDSLSGYLPLITSASTVMADQRYVGIFGLRDTRMALATPIAQVTSLWKFDVGHSVKAIWDLSKCNAYKSMICGVSPSAIIIPQNTYFQIYGYSIATNTAHYVLLEGVVVEPRGKVISP